MWISVPLPLALRFNVTPNTKETNPRTVLVLAMFLIPHRLVMADPDPDRDPNVREDEEAGVEHMLIEPKVTIVRRRLGTVVVVEVAVAVEVVVGRSNDRASPIFRLAELAFNVFDNQAVVIPRVCNRQWNRSSLGVYRFFKGYYKRMKRV
jgi:hypothetical protein